MNENFVGLSTEMALDRKSHGTVSFSDDVLKKISEIAASKIDGVVNIQIPEIKKEELQIQISLSTTLVYKTSLFDIAKNIQDEVQKSLQYMTGLEVVSVDVNVRALKIAD